MHLKNTSELVNFCVAILILKVEEEKQHFWHIMLYYFKKDKNGAETQKRICVLCGEGAVTDQMCQTWFVKFLGAIDILANNSLLWGCLMHWKAFSSSPGLYPLEANSGR